MLRHPTQPFVGVASRYENRLPWIPPTHSQLRRSTQLPIDRHILPPIQPHQPKRNLNRLRQLITLGCRDRIIIRSLLLQASDTSPSLLRATRFPIINPEKSKISVVVFIANYESPHPASHNRAARLIPRCSTTSPRLHQITKTSNDQLIRSPRSTKKKSPHW
jgi:hypothetical protein